MTIVNNDAGGFGGPIHFLMGSDTAAQLYAAQSQPAMPNHPVAFGTFLRTGPTPYGIALADGTLDPQKTQDALDAGVQIGRTSEESFFNDLTGINEGMTFTRDDLAINFMLLHGITPYIDLEAGPVLYAVGGMDTTQPLMHNPAEFGSYCLAAAQHLHATFPQLGATVPALFGTPANEPNGVWDASLTDNPALYAESADGPALYMKACYASIKAVFPTNSTVYGGELKTQPVNGVTDMVSEISRWYAGSAACHVGTCFDGLSLHLATIGDPTYAYDRCFEVNDGWTFSCIGAMQAVATAHGDLAPHVIVSETVIDSVQNSDTSAGDEAGQAWYLSKEFAFAQNDPSIDAMIWGNLSEDGLYIGTEFFGGSLIDTSSATERRKPAFYAFERFTRYPHAVVDPTAPQVRAPYEPRSSRR